jgi:hypothetical protein
VVETGHNFLRCEEIPGCYQRAIEWLPSLFGLVNVENRKRKPKQSVSNSGCPNLSTLWKKRK